MVSDLPKVTELLSGEAENKTEAPDIQSSVLSAVPWDLGIWALLSRGEKAEYARSPQGWCVPGTAPALSCRQSLNPFRSDTGDS